MFSSIIAAMARAQGLDISSSHERGRDGLFDDEQLLFAVQEGRCLVTRDYDEFIDVTTRFMERGYPHAGVLFVPRSLLGSHYAALAGALVHFAQAHPDGLAPYTIMWLSPAP